MTMINYKRTRDGEDRELTMNLDLDSMPGGLAARLQSLLSDSHFFDIPLTDEPDAGPEEYQYDITVVAGNSIHRIRHSDSSMPASLRPLVEELTNLGETTT